MLRATADVTLKLFSTEYPALWESLKPHFRLGERPFTEVYENFSGRNTVVHLDAGLVKITDVCKWRATVNGKIIQDMVEFSADTASLDWIGFHVVAHGAVSGDIEGEIRALFYRYKTVGGRRVRFGISDGKPHQQHSKTKKAATEKQRRARIPRRQRRS